MKIQSDSEILNAKTRSDILIEIKGADNQRRRDEYLKRDECYNDRTKEYVIQLAEKEFDSATVTEMKHRSPGVSIVKKVVNKKARVYLRQPDRVLQDRPEQDQEIFEGLVDELELNQVMKTANRRLELHKNVGVAVLPMRDHKASLEEGQDLYKVVLKPQSPQYLDVIPAPDDPERAMVVIFSYHYGNTQSGNADYRQGDSVDQRIADTSRDKGSSPENSNERYVWWSDNYHFTTDSTGAIIEDLSPFPGENGEGRYSNPIARLPYVFLHKGQQGDFWSEGGEDLTDTAILINLLLADLFFVSKYQGMGVFYAFGKDIPKNLKTGPNHFLTGDLEAGDPTPSIGFATSSPPIAAHIEMITTLTAFLLTTNDLEPGAIAATLSAGNAASGVQELIQRSEPSTAIEDDQQTFLDREQDIVDLALRWVEVYEGTGSLSPKWAEFAKLGTNLDYTLSFPSPEVFIGEAQRLEIVGKKLDLKLIDKAGALMEINQDLTREEAEEMAEKLTSQALETAKAFGLGGISNKDDKEPQNGAQDENEEEEEEEEAEKE